MMFTTDLSINEYNSYFQSYIDRMAHTDLWEAFSNHRELMTDFIENIDESKLLYRYAEGKWSIKEVILHMIDTERIFSYRALRIGRNDKTHLHGFDEVFFAEYSAADTRSVASLIEEYRAVRIATQVLFRSFTPAVLAQVGVVNNNNVSVRAIAFIILGHEKHHLEIIKERYL